MFLIYQKVVPNVSSMIAPPQWKIQMMMMTILSKESGKGQISQTSLQVDIVNMIQYSCLFKSSDNLPVYSLNCSTATLN